MNKEGISVRARKWIFTIQGNYSQNEVFDTLKNIEEIQYVKVALEQGKTGNFHLQGYMELSNKKSLIGCRKLFKENPLTERVSDDLNTKNWENPHLEIAWNPMKAQEYIGNVDFKHEDGQEKGGAVFWVFEVGEFVPDRGEARRQGKSWNDSLLEIKVKIDAGASLRELYDEYFIQMIYCGRAVREYMNLCGEETWKKIFEEKFLHNPTKEQMDGLQAEIDSECQGEEDK
jgi:hypothetical protein